MADAALSSFAGLLRHHRLAAGLTQEELAERAALSARAVSDLERGLRTSPRRETVELLAVALCLSPEARSPFIAAAAWRRGPARPAGGDALPLEMTSLVGREMEVARLLHELRWEGSRLVTLVGPGGVGKTRLAVRVVRDLAGDFPDGVAFLSLSALTDPETIPAVTARALGLRQQERVPVDDLVCSHLADRRFLLVFDNFEHLLPGAAFVARLLAACPHVGVLATSRSPLCIQGERRIEVKPLGVGALSAVRGGGRHGRGPAVELFAQRARDVQPDFALTPETEPAVAEICRAVDGLPLAIELAAARSAVLPPADLLARLNPRLPLLAGGPRDVEARQRTMRDAIAWSYDLLDGPEAALFRRLSVFAGGCDLEAVETVCLPATGADVVTLLAGLIDKSLLQRHEDRSRFVMLQTVREFARDVLAESGEAPPVEQAHARYFASLAAGARRHLGNTERAVWLNALQEEHDNLRTALETALRFGDVETGLILVGNLWPFWDASNDHREARQWIEAFVPGCDPARIDPAILATALSAHAELLSVLGESEPALALAHRAHAAAREAGDRWCEAACLFLLARHEVVEGRWRRFDRLAADSLALFRELGDLAGVAAVRAQQATLARFQGRHQQAAMLYREALAASEAIDDVAGAVATLARLGNLAAEQGKPAEALPFYEQALARHEESGDAFGRADVLYRYGSALSDLGDDAAAAPLLAESLRLYRSAGSKYGIAWVLLNQAESAVRTGDLASARHIAGESLALFEEIGDRRPTAIILMILGDVATRERAYAEAKTLYAESLSLSRDLEASPLVAAGLERLVCLACAQDRWEQAARLHGAAQRIRSSTQSRMAPADRPRYDRALATARGATGQAEWERWEAEGRALTPAEVLASAQAGAAQDRAS